MPWGSVKIKPIKTGPLTGGNQKLKEIIMTDIYKKLAKHLDNLPGGFPETQTGVELRILKRLFKPEEAEMACNLSMIMEPARDIAKRLNRDEAETENLLKTMSEKGLILRVKKGDKAMYMSAQFVVGIWEFHVNDLDEGLIKDFNEYVPYLVKNQTSHKTQQLRVIPISETLSGEMRVMPYDQAEEIIKSQSKIVVAPCICRREHKMVGEGCGKLEEACLVFGGGAYYYEENKLGRPIDKEEALEILHKAIDQGLVIQPGNSKKPGNICLCCGCCCQILKNIKNLDQPGKIVNSSYYTVVIEDNCTGCAVCEQRCPMDAICVEETARIDRDRCIGCGVCITGCEYEALMLMEKDESEKWEPPPNIVSTYITIAKERSLI